MSVRSRSRTGLLATLLVVITAAATLLLRRLASVLKISYFEKHNVAEVAVDGPITRDRRGQSPLSRPIARTAEEVIDAIDRADEDPNVDALLLRLNTPGGEVLPSDDIRRAAADFDGPTIGYATDVCASGGYWIASGCEEVWAHESSLVGSIGVVGSRPNLAELADKLGVDYEQFTAGEYKDAGTPLKEIDEEEREYLQGIVDGFYEQFVETVSEGRELDPDTVRDTEARVFLGEDAHERGLVDELGTREAVETRLEELIEEPVEIAEFTPRRGLAERIGIGANQVAYSLGTGLGNAVTDGTTDLDIQLR